jgi:hypothetical protein
LSLGLASAGVTGALSGTDWTTFNSKQQALNGTGFVKISGTTISYDNSTYLTTAAAASTYLPLAGGTMTGNVLFNVGDPTITLSPSSYSGQYRSIFATRSNAEGVLQLGNNGANFIVAGNTGTGGALSFYVNATSSFVSSINGTLALTLTSVGAANFTSTVTAAQYRITNNGTNPVYNIVDATNTYAGLYVMQAGAGSAGFGGSFIAYGHSHATKAGWTTAGISSGSGGRFSVNTQGLGNGTDVFTVDTSGNGVFNGSVTATSFIRSGGTSSQFLKADGSVDSNSYYLESNPSAFIALTALSGTAPIQYNNTTGAISITQASGSTNGFLSSTDWNTFNNKTSNVGTVTSVAALTLGTTGTDLSSSVANGTTTPVITLNVPTASAANRGALSAADWTTFNSKENAITAGTTAQYYRGDKTFQTLNTAAVPELTNLYYTEARVNANTNVAANTAARHNAVTLGTANGLSLSTQQLSLGLASSSANGALSSTDWTTFNNKQNALTNPVTGTGVAGQVAYWSSGSAITGESNLFWDSTNDRLGIGTNTPTANLEVYNASQGNIYISSASGNASALRFFSGGNEYVTLRNLANGNFDIETGTGSPATRLRIFSNGNVFIGSSPSNAGFKLDVNGTGRFSGAVQFSGDINPTSNNSSLVWSGSGNKVSLNANNGILDFYVGTSSYFKAFTIASTGAATFSSFVTASYFKAISGATYSEYIYDGMYSTGTDQYIFTGGAYNTRFLTNGSERMRITSGGNVLIGTGTDAGFKLDVNGTGRFSGNTTITGNLTLNGAVTRNINFFDSSNTNLNAQIQYDQISSNSGQLFFKTNNSGTFSTKLTIANTGAATFSSTLQTTHIGINNAPTLARLFATQTTDGEWIATFKNYGGSASYGVSIDMSGSTSGESAFQVYTSTGNGLRLVNNSRLLIGTFTDSGYQLDVNGTGRFSQTLNLNGTNPNFDLQNSGTSRFRLELDGSNFTYLSTLGANNMILRTNSTARLTLDGSTGAATFSSTLLTEGNLTTRTTNSPTQSILLNAIPVNDNSISLISFGARFNSTTYGTGAQIRASAAGTWSSTNYGTNLIFSTVTQNTDVNTERLIISASGTVRITNLAGSGSRMVVADANGLLSTQAISTGTVTNVTASSPLFSSGGATPNITIQQASGSQNGFLSSTDWTTFNNKVSGSGTAGQVAYWSSGSAITGESNLFWDATNDRLGIGTATPAATLEINGNIRTGAPTGGTAVNWRLGTARGGTVTTNATVRVEIDGALVDLVARYV